ncbi:unnamed protein product [Victoria cruziana]
MKPFVDAGLWVSTKKGNFFMFSACRIVGGERCSGEAVHGCRLVVSMEKGNLFMFSACRIVGVERSSGEAIRGCRLVHFCEEGFLMPCSLLAIHGGEQSSSEQKPWMPACVTMRHRVPSSCTALWMTATGNG